MSVPSGLIISSVLLADIKNQSMHIPISLIDGEKNVNTCYNWVLLFSFHIITSTPFLFVIWMTHLLRTRGMRFTPFSLTCFTCTISCAPRCSCMYDSCRPQPHCTYLNLVVPMSSPKLDLGNSTPICARRLTSPFAEQTSLLRCLQLRLPSTGIRCTIQFILID